jgi:ZIP family zinc transporter
MLSALYAAGAHTDDGTGWQLPSTETLVAVVLVAVATVVGAWLARRGSGRSALPLAAASGILLIIAVLDLLPDAWDEAHEAGVPLWAVPVTALASYGVMGAVVRIGCPCERGRAGGIGAASGLVLHRLLEGATLALTASVTVVAAILVHAASEGLALAALLGVQPGRRMAPWIGLACLSPVAGAFVTSALPIPDGIVPLLLAFVGGVLAQAAWVALRLAHHQRPADRRVLGVPAAMAMTLAAILTALVVLVGAVNR